MKVIKYFVKLWKFVRRREKERIERKKGEREREWVGESEWERHDNRIKSRRKAFRRERERGKKGIERGREEGIQWERERKRMKF